MTGFSTQWLALREPIDHVSRNLAVQSAMLNELQRRHGSSFGRLKVMDMGCGTGSNLRALAPLLGPKQCWQLIDYDEELLNAAKQLISEWADSVVEQTTSTLCIHKDASEIRIEFLQADLNQSLEELLDVREIDLLTSSALLDLVSTQWLEKLCTRLACPLYAVLTYDGRMQWTPMHALDLDVVQAFNEHQLTDKGFGAAAGWKAIDIVEQLMKAQGATVVKGDSCWTLDGDALDFQKLLLQGVAGAVGETQRIAPADVNDWLTFRLSNPVGAVGHQDLFIAPKISTSRR